MSMTGWTVFIAVVVIAAIIVTFVYLRQRRSARLRSRFGREYDHAVAQYGGRYSAEKALEDRAERTERYQIRRLNDDEQHRFAEEWRKTQARFVDDPSVAVRDADTLVCEVMRVRGYPMADFERRAEDLSVDHPEVIRNYRTAHDIAEQDKQQRGPTEDLRRAMVCYRELFDDLLESHPAHLEGR